MFIAFTYARLVMRYLILVNENERNKLGRWCAGTRRQVSLRIERANRSLSEPLPYFDAVDNRLNLNNITD